MNIFNLFFDYGRYDGGPSHKGSFSTLQKARRVIEQGVIENEASKREPLKAETIWENEGWYIVETELDGDPVKETIYNELGDVIKVLP